MNTMPCGQTFQEYLDMVRINKMFSFFFFVVRLILKSTVKAMAHVILSHIFYYSANNLCLITLIMIWNNIALRYNKLLRCNKLK